VNDLVAHADDVRPRDFRVLRAKLSGDVATSFSDDLNEMDERQAEILVGIVVGARDALCLADGFPRHVEHVLDIDEITRRHTAVRRRSGPDRESDG